MPKYVVKLLHNSGSGFSNLANFSKKAITGSGMESGHRPAHPKLIFLFRQENRLKKRHLQTILLCPILHDGEPRKEHIKKGASAPLP